jgi:biopolymer transport protein ExbD
MRLNRSIRNRGKRRKNKPLDLDITPLLDILVILLVFLLKSYNSQGIILDVPKGISLPISESQQVSDSGVIVLISPSAIFVDNVEVLNRNKPKKSDYDQGGRRMAALYNELVKKKETVKVVEKSTRGGKSFSGLINLVIDKSVPYKFIKKVMHTSAEAGYQKYKFVVLGEE